MNSLFFTGLGCYLLCVLFNMFDMICVNALLNTIIFFVECTYVQRTRWSILLKWKGEICRGKSIWSTW